MSDIVKDTLAHMAGEDSDETRGWDDGALYAAGIEAEVQKELDTLRRLKYSEAYIDAWKFSAESIFYSLTDESK